MDFAKHKTSLLSKILLVILTLFLVILPCNETHARKAMRTGSTRTKSVKCTKKRGNKSKIGRKKKSNLKKRNKKSTNAKGKQKKYRKRGKRRNRRGSARYVSSAESVAQKRKIAETAAKLKAHPDLSGEVVDLAIDSYVWPIRYGYIARGVGRRHSGVDMMSRAGEAIYAVADGIVKSVSINNPNYRGYGKMCIISHKDKGTTSLYSHCAAIYVHEGQAVKRGQKIAIVGRTGRTTTNHLHFEMRKNGRRINPERVLPKIGALGHKYVPH